MGLTKLLKNRNAIFIAIVGILFFTAYVTLRIFSTERESVMFFISTLLNPYFSITESIANSIIKLFHDGISIQNHQIIFNNYPEYYKLNRAIIENWTVNLLYYKWIAFLLISFWLAHSPIKKKFKYTFLLIIVHLFAVISGLIMLAGIGPILNNPESISAIGYRTIGRFALFMLFAIWVKNSTFDIELALKKVKVNFKLPEKKINEVLFVFLLLILLKNFFIPYPNYDSYIAFYLKATKYTVYLLGFHSEINGAYLSGTNGGTLLIAKWCLGIKTMFIFAAMVYLTRRDNKTSWIYIMFGIIILHILNIIRLSFLFIFVQNHNDSELIMEHHDLYNIVVYLCVLILWIIWFEKYTMIRKRKKKIKP